MADHRYNVRNIVRIDMYSRTGDPAFCNGCPHHRPPALPWGNLCHECKLGANSVEDYREIRHYSSRYDKERPYEEHLRAVKTEPCKRPSWCRQEVCDG